MVTLPAPYPLLPLGFCSMIQVRSERVGKKEARGKMGFFLWTGCAWQETAMCPLAGIHGVDPLCGSLLLDQWPSSQPEPPG